MRRTHENILAGAHQESDLQMPESFSGVSLALDTPKKKFHDSHRLYVLGLKCRMGAMYCIYPPLISTLIRYIDPENCENIPI